MNQPTEPPTTRPDDGRSTGAGSRYDILIQRARRAETTDALKAIGRVLVSWGRPAGGQQQHDYHRVERAVLERTRAIVAGGEAAGRLPEMACTAGGEVAL